MGLYRDGFVYDNIYQSNNNSTNQSTHIRIFGTEEADKIWWKWWIRLVSRKGCCRRLQRGSQPQYHKSILYVFILTHEFMLQPLLDFAVVSRCKGQLIVLNRPSLFLDWFVAWNVRFCFVHLTRYPKDQSSDACSFYRDEKFVTCSRNVIVVSDWRYLHSCIIFISNHIFPLQPARTAKCKMKDARKNMRGQKKTTCRWRHTYTWTLKEQKKRKKLKKKLTIRGQGHRNGDSCDRERPTFRPQRPIRGARVAVSCFIGPFFASSGGLRGNVRPGYSQSSCFWWVFLVLMYILFFFVF